MTGATPIGVGPSQVEPVTVSPLRASVPSAAHTSGLVVVDPFARQLLRQGDGAVIFSVPDDSPLPIDEMLANLDRVSALWNTFHGFEEPATFVSELIAALAQYRDDLRRPPGAGSVERRIAMIGDLIARAQRGRAR